MMPNLIRWEFKLLPQSDELDDMIRCILLCHECVRLEEKIIEKQEFKEDEYEAFSAVKSKKEIKKANTNRQRHVSTIEHSKYNIAGRSHDELVLLNLVEEKYESRFVSRIGSDIKISIRGQEENYKIIKIYEFTSGRKMMSVSVIRLTDNAIISFSKGADSVMTKLLNNKNYLEKNVIEDIEVYTSTGYRTLMFGKRYLTKEQAGLNVF
jgi:magnesium-transporting ATPase (P-type)